MKRELPLADADIDRLQSLLDALPAPLEPLDTTSLDGFLCGVLLQPRREAPERWLKYVTDIDGRPAPAGKALSAIESLVRRRHAELDAAIAARRWFDPWIYQLEAEDGESEGPSASVLPWVAGFAAAQDLYPALMRIDDAALIEPLAILYAHFDPADLENADALLSVIEELEPPPDLAEAVQDVVRAVMLIADVTRPRAS